jgi:hypothetical protein
MKSFWALVGVVTLVALVGSAVWGQSPSPDSNKVADTVIYVPQMEQHVAGDVTNAVNLEKHLIQTPTIALFKSMLVPGLGQIGNRRFIKAGIFIGLETWFAVKAIHYSQQAHGFRSQYAAATDVDVKLATYALYRNRRDSRNKFIWFFGLTTLVSMFDAYVDAHLSGSPINPRNDQFTVDIAPDPRGGATAQLAFRF